MLLVVLAQRLLDTLELRLVVLHANGGVLGRDGVEEVVVLGGDPGDAVAVGGVASALWAVGEPGRLDAHGAEVGDERAAGDGGVDEVGAPQEPVAGVQGDGVAGGVLAERGGDLVAVALQRGVAVALGVVVAVAAAERGGRKLLGAGEERQLDAGVERDRRGDERARLGGEGDVGRIAMRTVVRRSRRGLDGVEEQWGVVGEDVAGEEAHEVGREQQGAGGGRERVGVHGAGALVRGLVCAGGQ